MSLVIKDKKGPSFPPIDAGVYSSVCVGVIDLGEQYSEAYKKYQDKVLFIWELPDVTVEVEGEQKPRWLSKDFSATLNTKSKLSEFLVQWRGKPFSDGELRGGFDVSSMLGMGCLLQVIVEEKDGRQFNRITGVMGFPSGMEAPTTSSELLLFDMDTLEESVLEKVPEWIVERIRRSTQYQKKHAPETVIAFPDEITEGTDGRGEEGKEG